MCGVYCVSKSCTSNTTCSACIDGYQGANCEMPCPDGYYGPNCALACLICAMLHSSPLTPLDQTYTITGTVKKGTAAVSGATVSSQGKTAMTNIRGQYTLRGILIPANQMVSVTAAKTGVINATKTATLNPGNFAVSVNFVAPA